MRIAIKHIGLNMNTRLTLLVQRAHDMLIRIADNPMPNLVGCPTVSRAESRQYFRPEGAGQLEHELSELSVSVSLAASSFWSFLSSRERAAA